MGSPEESQSGDQEPEDLLSVFGGGPVDSPSPDDAEGGDSTDLPYTVICFVSRRLWRVQSATAPALHFPLQKWLVATIGLLAQGKTGSLEVMSGLKAEAVLHCSERNVHLCSYGVCIC